MDISEKNACFFIHFTNEGVLSSLETIQYEEHEADKITESLPPKDQVQESLCSRFHLNSFSHKFNLPMSRLRHSILLCVLSWSIQQLRF